MDTTTFRRANYSGYLVRDRDLLLSQLVDAGVPALYGRVVAEHVTHTYPDPRPAPAAEHVRIVGHVAAGGVQALLVEVDGTTVRPDGRPYHLTYSLAPGHKPVESNSLLAAHPVTPLCAITVAVDAF